MGSTSCAQPRPRWRACFVDEPELKIARMNVAGRPEPDGTLRLLFEYLVGTPAGLARFTEEHTTTLFSRAAYAEALERAGLRAAFEPEGLMPERGLWIGVKTESAPTRS